MMLSDKPKAKKINNNNQFFRFDNDNNDHIDFDDYGDHKLGKMKIEV